MYLGLTLRIFYFKIQIGFVSVTTFLRPSVIFLRVLFVGMINIFLATLAVFGSRVFRKNLYSLF